MQNEMEAQERLMQKRQIENVADLLHKQAVYDRVIHSEGLGHI